MASFPDGLDRQDGDDNTYQLGTNVCVKIVYQFVYSQLKGLLGIKVAKGADRYTNKEQYEGWNKNIIFTDRDDGAYNQNDRTVQAYDGYGNDPDWICANLKKKAPKEK